MYTNQSTDQQLRQGCLSGDRRARELFYRRFYGKLVGIPRRYVGNVADANAVLNQAFLRIFQSMDQYRDEGSFSGWLSTIVFHTTMSHLRKQQRQQDTVSIEEAYHDPPCSGGVHDQHDVEAIYAEIARLPTTLRSVFSLYVIDNFSHDEISKILQISVANSRWRLNQARAKLRARLAPATLNETLT